MKIALLTIWHEKNYGAELQAYATIKAIKHLGHCPEMINIHLVSKEQPSFLGRIANFIEKLLPASTKFERFWSYYIPKTKKYNSVSELYNDPPQADIYIVGSDQVWNPDITKEYWKMFFLDFGTTKVKRLSFSSSFGIKDWNHPEHVDFVKSALNQFSFVTCREDSGMKLLRDVFGVEATSVLDPTLLFDSYDEFVPNSQIRKTLVYYPLSEDWELTDYCENLAKKLGLTAINTNRKTTIFNKLIWNRVSIEQWVRNIAYSEFVITRSFHGLAFCLIYQRQFAILKSRNDRGTRLDNLLSKLDLQDRIYQNTMELDNAKPWENPIDYSILMPKLNALRKESWLTLERIIEKE